MDAKTLCLGVLTLGDATGYEIRKMFKEGPFAAFQDISFGSIYPALGQLRDQGLIQVRDATEAERADKKVYALTEAGRSAFRDALAGEAAPDKIRSDAVFMLFFSDLMAGEDRARVFEDYLRAYRERLDMMRSLPPRWSDPGRLFVRGLGEAFYDAIVTYMENNRDAFLAGEPPAGREGTRSAAAE